MPGARRPKFDAEVLGLVSTLEDGVRFETGVPVLFEFVHGTESAPYYGSAFGQDIEPHGMYVTRRHVDEKPAKGYVSGVATVGAPLVMALTTDDRIYGPNGWKGRLRAAFGKTGAALSRALLAAGFDAVVTVRIDGPSAGSTAEIVLLDPARQASVGRPPRRSRKR